MNIYKDAAIINFSESIIGPKLISITVFLIFAGLIGCFKIVFPSLKSNFSLGGSSIALVLLAITSTIIFCCYLFLTKWIYKIETSNEHLTTHSILKKKIIHGVKSDQLTWKSHWEKKEQLALQLTQDISLSI
jgi:hypothetical protein